VHLAGDGAPNEPRLDQDEAGSPSVEGC